jgi:hypothetical protein
MLYEKLTIGKLCTKNRGPVVSAPASYLGGCGLESQPGDRLSSRRSFVVLFSVFRQMPGWYLKLG